ncbi:MAG: alpha/beta fold hydrolase [Pseudonocardiaceae bacterium]|nr:alpha/beta fold hydrolase [Pseudonocardiaceae bacterium]
MPSNRSSEVANVREHTRRSALRGASVVGMAAMASTAPATVASARNRGPTTFVFVAGSNGSASNEPELAMRGHRTVGVNLPGHEVTSGQFRAAYQAPQDLDALATAPSPVAGTTLRDYARVTSEVVRRVARNGPVVLVGGSMGGATISLVGNQIPDLIDRIVYDAALCCVDLPTMTDYFTTAEGSTSLAPLLAGGAIGDPQAIGASRTNWRTADKDFLAKAKKALMAGGTDAEFFAMLNFLQPDEALSPMTENARVQARSWGRIPRTYIRHTEDLMIPIALQDRMITEADALTPDNRFDVRSVRTSHVPTAERYPEIVAILDELAL